jgi:hypothetical protein
MLPLLVAVWTALAATGDQATLSVPIDDARAALTSIVVADIDRDGDADVVATDGALHLFVWINDGTGHLVPQRPAHNGGAHGEAARPGVEGRESDRAAYAAVDPPAFDTSPAAATISLACTDVAPRTGARRFDLPRGACRLRGPPARS